MRVVLISNYIYFKPVAPATIKTMRKPSCATFHPNQHGALPDGLGLQSRN